MKNYDDKKFDFLRAVSVQDLEGGKRITFMGDSDVEDDDFPLILDAIYREDGKDYDLFDLEGNLLAGRKIYNVELTYDRSKT